MKKIEKKQSRFNDIKIKENQNSHKIELCQRSIFHFYTAPCYVKMDKTRQDLLDTQYKVA